MSHTKADENEAKKAIVTRIAVEAGALEHCEIHDTYFDPMDDEALEKAQGRAKELIESNDPMVKIFGGNQEELIELLDDVVADAEEACGICESDDEE